jgi:hypothetical protein
MTASRYGFAFSRRDSPESYRDRCPRELRGRRESRVLGAPAAPCAKVESTRVVATGSPVTSGFPRAMVLTVSSALSRVTGLFCHPRLRIIIRKLDASVGASGPHGFAVRVSAARQRVTKASTASRTNVRDDREAPLVSRKSGRMCERAVGSEPPVAGTEPAAPQKRQSLYKSEGQLRCLP